MPMANQIIRRVLAPIPVLILVVIAVIGGSFYFAYQQVDGLTEERQAQTIRNAFTQAGHGLERELRGETIWGDAFANASLAPDSKWLETYLGSYLTTLLGYSEVYVLDSADRPIYGYEDGQTRDGRGFEADRAGVADLIQALRDPTSGPASHAALTTVDLGGGRKVVHRAISDVRLLGGEASTVVIETILPDADPGAGIAIPERPALLVAVFHLDSAYLSTFGDSFQFSGLRWIGAGSTSTSGLSSVGSDEVSTRITARDGSVVGDVAWKRELPGQELLRRMTWGFGLAAALLLSIALFGVRYFRAQSQRIIDNERREARLARTDFLTGLPNRLALSEVLTSQLASIALSDRCVGVLNIDLDRFKQINDSHGHQAGDKALVAVGARLMAEFPECFVARTGGDEFAMLVPAATPDRVGIVADRVAFLLNAPLQINESLNASLGCSTGYAIAPLHGNSEAELMRRADLALYRAKKEARGRAHRFDSDLEAAALRRRAVEVALRRAVSANAIAVAYQPLMASDGETVVGVEALARWHDAELGDITPGEFIPIAEETGLIVELGEQVLRKSLIDALPWSNISVSVNVSAQQIQRVNMVETVERLLREYRFPASRLEIELTESVLVADDARADTQIRGLQKLGVKVALDDFGTGYASLLYLRQFGFDKLKIDRQFVMDSDTSVEARAMVISITSMSRTLGLDVTAEGVENAAQHEFLRIAGCDRLQGYLFSRPITPTQLSTFINDRRAAAA